MSNLDKAQALADAGAHEASIARSLIVIAAALKMMVEAEPAPKGVMQHTDWCQDPNCGNKLAHVKVDQDDWLLQDWCAPLQGANQEQQAQGWNVVCNSQHLEL